MGQHISHAAPLDWEVRHLAANVLQTTDILSSALERSNDPRALLIALVEGGGLAEALPELVEAVQPAAVLASVEDPAWFPRAARKRLAAYLEDHHIPYCYPSPFCALGSDLSKPIAAFAGCFGQPRLEIITRCGRIRKVTVVTDSPCGFASQSAPELCGVLVEEAEARARDLQARWPCPAGGRRSPLFPFALAVRLALESFEDAITPYLPDLRAYAYAWTGNCHDAEDLVQEALCQAFRFYYQFRRRTNLRAWLFRILENLIRYRHRQQAKAPEVVSSENLPPEEEGILAQKVSHTDQPEAVLLAKAFNSDWEAALQSLTFPLRETLLLDAAEGLSHWEIAARQGITVEAVKKRLMRARKQVRAFLGRVPGETDYGDDPRRKRF